MTAARRTANEICKDVASVLALPGLHSFTRRMVVYQAIWDWSELNGKYNNPDFHWSPKALAWQQSKRGDRKGIRREHVLPMTVTIEHILSLPKPREDDLAKLFRDASLICVVTVEEERQLNKNYRSRMPEGWKWRTGKKLRAQYEAVGIEHQRQHTHEHAAAAA